MTGVIFLDPCPNKLINCESINADLDLIYHQIYWECVFSFSKERQNSRLDDCLKEKCPKSKVSYIQKEIWRQTQFRILGCLFKQITDLVQHRDLLSYFQFLNLLSVKYRKTFTAALKILLYKVSNIEPSCSRWSWRHDELST